MTPKKEKRKKKGSGPKEVSQHPPEKQQEESSAVEATPVSGEELPTADEIVSQSLQESKTEAMEMVSTEPNPSDMVDAILREIMPVPEENTPEETVPVTQTAGQAPLLMPHGFEEVFNNEGEKELKTPPTDAENSVETVETSQTTVNITLESGSVVVEKGSTAEDSFNIDMEADTGTESETEAQEKTESEVDTETETDKPIEPAVEAQADDLQEDVDFDDFAFEEFSLTEELIAAAEEELCSPLDGDLPELSPDVASPSSAQKPLVGLLYSYTPADVKQGIKLFQQKTIYRKNFIYTIILLISLGLYACAIWLNTANSFAMFMMVISITFLGFIWYIPLSHRSRIVKAIDPEENNNRYILKVYRNHLETALAETPHKHNTYLFHSGLLRAFETDDLFVLAYNKIDLFIVPKRCFKHPKQLENLSRILKTKLKNDYYRK